MNDLTNLTYASGSGQGALAVSATGLVKNFGKTTMPTSLAAR